MARYTGPKNRLSRREGFDLFNKGEKLRRSNVKPGQIPIGKTKMSEYGRQLRAKQRAKRFYSVLEKQFINYVKKARVSKANPGSALVSLLERRLDNVVFRLGLAPTRPAARQLVTHGNILINGKTLDIPSYEVKIDEVVSLSTTAKKIPYILELIDEKPAIPSWLERTDEYSGKMVRIPELTDVREPISVIEIIEFYSR